MVNMVNEKISIYAVEKLKKQNKTKLNTQQIM